METVDLYLDFRQGFTRLHAAFQSAVLHETCWGGSIRPSLLLASNHDGRHPHPIDGGREVVAFGKDIAVRPGTFGVIATISQDCPTDTCVRSLRGTGAAQSVPKISERIQVSWCR